MPSFGSLLKKKKTKESPLSPVTSHTQTGNNSSNLSQTTTQTPSTVNSGIASTVTTPPVSSDKAPLGEQARQQQQQQQQEQQQQQNVPIQSNEPANNNTYMYQNQQTSPQPPQQQQQQQISSSPQQNANSMQGVVSHAPPPNGLQQHAVQQTAQQSTQAAPPAVFAQPNAPANAKAANIKPMADGTWPVMRDVKGTKGKYTITDFQIGRTLGTGSFGRVHMSQSKHNQRFYAIKVLKKQQVVKMKQIEHTNDERRMLAKVKHPFLVTLWGTFSDAKNLYMVMDFVEGGELFSLLRKSQVSKVVLEWSRMFGLTMHNRDSRTQWQSSTLLK